MMSASLPSNNLYQQIKQDIRDHKLPIGCALKQQQLAAQYGVSRIPIRDVLQRLRNEGWLTATGKRGVMIHALNAIEAEDLYMMRMYLEPMILGYAIPLINHQVIGQATDILEQLQRGSLDIQQHGALNWQFHACLYQAAKRPTQFNNIHNLHQLCSRYIGFHSVKLDYQAISQQQHYQLLEVIQAKQLDQAQGILKAHICDAGQLLVEHLQQAKGG